MTSPTFLAPAALCIALALTGCKQPAPPEATPPPTAGAEPTATPPPSRSFFSWHAPAATPLPPPPAEIWKLFSGEKAFVHVEKLVAFGPRPSGSAALDTSRKYIVDAVKAAGWEVTRQEFDGQTPHGPVHFVNLIARHAGSGAGTSQRIIVGSHYDTKLFSTISFVGASDGGSSTGALIELARVLSMDPAMAAQIELVFFDGEEAVTQFTATDGLYGSRHYAEELARSGRARQFKTGIVWDMIGDKDLTITLPSDTPPTLASGLFTAAEALADRDYFRYAETPILDDHVPLTKVGVPSIDIIDFDYIYWHTADDTLDKISAHSLETVGAVTLYFLRQTLAR